MIRDWRTWAMVAIGVLVISLVAIAGRPIPQAILLGVTAEFAVGFAIWSLRPPWGGGK